MNLLCYKGTVLAYIQLCVLQGPLGLWRKAAFQQGGPQQVLLYCSIPCVPLSPFLQPFGIPLGGSMNLWADKPHLPVLCHWQTSEAVLRPIIQNINDDIEQSWMQCWCLGYTTWCWPQLGFMPPFTSYGSSYSTSFQSASLSTHPAHASLGSFWRTYGRHCQKPSWSAGR